MLTTILVALGIAFVSVVVGILRWHLWLKWWEVLLMVPLPVAVCMIVHAVAVSGSSTDYEVRTSWVQRVVYEEAWNERQSRTRVISVGKTTTVQVYYVTVEHSPKWWAESAHGASEPISQHRYEQIRQHWEATPQFTELNRRFHTKDGDRYVCHFPGDDAKLIPFTSEHAYENRVRVAPSLFEYNQEPHGAVYDYPTRIYEAAPSVIGSRATPEERHAFDVLNARLGHPLNVRVLALIRPNTSPSAAWNQEVAWLGGHRNELVIVIGTYQGRTVQWCRVFGWTQSESLKVAIRQQVLAQDELDLVALAGWLTEALPQSYEARDMSHFNYLPVDVSWWVYLLAGLLAAGGNVGLMAWLILNEHHDHPHARIHRLDRWSRTCGRTWGRLVE